jgi:hypothetical protein
MELAKKDFANFEEIQGSLNGLTFSMLKILQEEEVIMLGKTGREKVLLKLFYHTCLKKNL